MDLHHFLNSDLTYLRCIRGTEQESCCDRASEASKVSMARRALLQLPWFSDALAEKVEPARETYLLVHSILAVGLLYT